ncbi:MAG: tRNA1(Val) (adenine(37)-N6)-methyltransferase [Treponema sp.]|nr:tRNA1(Val) (adenine(37)-N6)-methyltransferase [Candidatus Treponema merdequi]
MEFDSSDDIQIEKLHIKGLKLIQNRKQFMFGIDAVLLSDFAKVRKGNLVFDLGSGNGIIAVLIASKNDVKVKAVEVQKSVFELTEQNIKINSLENKIEAVNINVKDIKKNFDAQIADVVVSNPPYIKSNSAVKNETEALSIARHEILAELDDFVKAASYVLKPNGKFYLIHKPERIAEIIISCSKYNLELKQMRLVVPQIEKDAVMVLMQFVKCAKPGVKVEKSLVIYGEDGEYTDEVKKIYERDA